MDSSLALWVITAFVQKFVGDVQITQSQTVCLVRCVGFGASKHGQHLSVCRQLPFRSSLQALCPRLPGRLVRRVDGAFGQFQFRIPESSLNDGLVYVKNRLRPTQRSRRLRCQNAPVPLLTGLQFFLGKLGFGDVPATAMAPNISSFSFFSMATVRNIGKCSPFKRLPMV